MVLGLLVAVMLGTTGELAFSALGGASPSPTTSAVAAISPSASTGTTPPTAGTPTPTPFASPTLDTNSPAPYATITFRDLLLEVLPAGQTRTFTFTSDGPGNVSARIVAAAPLNGTKICIAMNDGPATCATGATPGVTGVIPSTGVSTDWKVTVIGTKAGATPVVDLDFVWPTRSPAMTMSQARFQGLPNPDAVRGFAATFETRSPGTMTLDASWAPVMTNASVILSDVTKTPVVVDRQSFAKTSSISPPYTHQVDASHTYQI